MLGWAMARSSMMRLARKRSVRLMSGDLGGEASEEQRLFHGGIAAADDGDLLARGEEAVAGGAGADAVADQRLLAGQVEPAGAGAGRDDQRARVDRFLAGAEVQLVRVLAEVDRDEVGHLQLGAEARGLLLHVLDQFRALDALPASRESSRPAW